MNLFRLELENQLRRRKLEKIVVSKLCFHGGSSCNSGGRAFRTGASSSSGSELRQSPTTATLPGGGRVPTPPSDAPQAGDVRLFHRLQLVDCAQHRAVMDYISSDRRGVASDRARAL
ncbi:hypothetical protein NL676_018403 [Syzygium grande]|nr:hypothetical protein NL676_018403 [Syzygium grande]